MRRALLVLAIAALAAAGCRVDSEEADTGGAQAPDFALEDLAGNRVQLAALRGRPVVIDFWATWCTPCVFQIPILNEFHAQRGDRVAVLGVSVDVDGREVVVPFAEEHEIEYPVLLGDPELAQRYGAMGFPTLYVLSPDGTIHSAHVGVIDRAELEEAVEAAESAAGRSG